MKAMSVREVGDIEAIEPPDVDLPEPENGKALVPMRRATGVGQRRVQLQQASKAGKRHAQMIRKDA